MKQKQKNVYKKESEVFCRQCNNEMIEISHKDITEKLRRQPYLTI